MKPATTLNQLWKSKISHISEIKKVIRINWIKWIKARLRSLLSQKKNKNKNICEFKDLNLALNEGVDLEYSANNVIFVPFSTKL